MHDITMHVGQLERYMARFGRSAEPLGLFWKSSGPFALMDGVPPPIVHVCSVCVCVHAVDQGHDVVDIPRLGFPGTEMADGRGQSGLSDSIAIPLLVVHYSFVLAVAGLCCTIRLFMQLLAGLSL